MDENDKDLCRRWKIIQEQLISLWVFHRRSPGGNEFFTFLNEGFTLSTMSLSTFTQICYFLLGLINKEERDKLIKWPVINIQGQVKFRKGVSAIVKGLIEKYPQMNLKRLPESYLIDPSHNQKKILDFILKLSNLAIQLTVNNPYLLIMRTKNDMNATEIETAITMVNRARLNEEKIIEENTFPIVTFENIRTNITDKCVAVKQENLNLTNKLHNLKKKLIEDGLVEKEEDCNVDNLTKMHNEKLEEVSQMNFELKKFSEHSKHVVDSVKASGEPFSLTANDFGSEEGGNSLEDVTQTAYNKLSALFDFMRCKEALPQEKEEYLKSLEDVRKALVKERNVLHSFLLKYAAEVDDSNINL